MLPLPFEQVMNRDGQSKAEFVKKLHQQVKENLEKRTRQYQTRANKGKKQVTFDVGDWVWVHFRKERFPAQRSSKLFEVKSFSRRGDDVSTSAPAPIVDPEVLPQGPITRSKAKQFREALFLTCAKLSDSFDINYALEHKCVNVLHTDVEIKDHVVKDLSLARLKFRSSYAAHFSSTKCHTSAS
ncbi:hypothetical protein GQ457_02G026760 [Hibiscus cannabinus]